jgi:hypothetical protein
MSKNVFPSAAPRTQQLSHRLCIADSPTAFFDIDRMFIQSFKPLNDTANQETPTPPECSKTAFVDSAAVSGSKSKSSAECEANALVQLT